MSAPIFEIKNISVNLNAKTILPDITFDAATGEFIGVIGPNGAGKTTLIRAMTGFQETATGTRVANGEDISAMAASARAKVISYLPQARPVHWAISVRQLVALGRFAYGASEILEGANASAVTRAMEETGMAPFADRPVAELSGGERARAHLARLLAAETPIVIADEPIAALDPRHQFAVMEILKTRANDGALVIAALHHLDLAVRYCSRIIVLDQGRIIADGRPRDVLSQEILERTFGVTGVFSSDGTRASLSLAPAI